jgi:hypothetical protein
MNLSAPKQTTFIVAVVLAFLGVSKPYSAGLFDDAFILAAAHRVCRFSSSLLRRRPLTRTIFSEPKKLHPMPLDAVFYFIL